MADLARRVRYYHTTTPDRPGEGARVLGALRDAGVNLLAFHAFPRGDGAQLDFVPEDQGRLESAASQAGIALGGPKTAFLVEGEDRPGAAAEILRTLADAGVNVVAMDAIRGGEKRFGALLWVDPAKVEDAATALGAG